MDEKERSNRKIKKMIVCTTILNLLTYLIIYIYLKWTTIDWIGLGGGSGPDFWQRTQGNIVAIILTLIYSLVFYIIARRYIKFDETKNKRDVKYFYILTIVIFIIYILFNNVLPTAIEEIPEYYYMQKKQEQIQYYNSILKPGYRCLNVEDGVIIQSNIYYLYVFEKEEGTVKKEDIDYLLSIIETNNKEIVIEVEWNKRESKGRFYIDKDKNFKSVEAREYYSNNEALDLVFEYTGIRYNPNVYRVKKKYALKDYIIFDELRSNEETIKRNDGNTYIFVSVEGKPINEKIIQVAANVLNDVKYSDVQYIVSMKGITNENQEIEVIFKTDGEYSYPKEYEIIEWKNK